MSQSEKSLESPLPQKESRSSLLALLRGKMDSFWVGLAFTIFVLSFFFAGSSFGFVAGKSVYYKAGLMIGGVFLSILCLFLTNHWPYLMGLIRGARIELNKVHWPSKDEWSKSTMMVLAIVSLFSILLMFIDWLIALLVKMVL